ncbi:MAG: DUF1048 domain-containing protein [Bacillus sp. (in: firmicutes)]
MKVEDLVKENAEKQKLLSEENEKVYGDILLYIRLSSVDEKWSEELLLEILDHILEGQAEGKSAREIVGDDPKAYCEELLAELPKDKKWFKKDYLGFLVIPYAMYLIPNAFLGGLSLSFFNVVLAPLFFVTTIYTFLWALKKETYSKHKLLYYFVPFFSLFLSIIMTGLHEFIDVATIEVNKNISIAIGIILSVLLVRFYVKWKFWDTLLFFAVIILIGYAMNAEIISVTVGVSLLILNLIVSQLVSILKLKRSAPNNAGKQK